MTIVYQNETSYCGPISMLRKLDNGDLVVVFREALWTGGRPHQDPTTRTSFIRSTDGGETWHTLVTPDPAGGNCTTVNQLSDSTLIATNAHVLFIPESDEEKYAHRPTLSKQHQPGMLAVVNGVHVMKSSNGGYTWTPASVIDGAPLDTTTAGGVIELGDGSLLIPLNDYGPDGFEGSWVARSTDLGDTWTYQGSVCENTPELGFAEMRILRLASGRILAAMRTRENFYQSHSDDEGNTWAEIKDTGIWCGGSSPFDLQQLADGRVLATYAHRREPFGIRACLSDDGGATWDVENGKILRDNGIDLDMGYPSSQQLDDGTILTVYYWHNEDEVRYLDSMRWTTE
jgi:sialidase-1